MDTKLAQGGEPAVAERGVITGSGREQQERGLHGGEREREALTGGAGYSVDRLDEQRGVVLRILHKHQQQLQGRLHHQAGLREKSILMSGALTGLSVPGGGGRAPGAGPEDEGRHRKTPVLGLGSEVQLSFLGTSGLLQPLCRRGN